MNKELVKNGDIIFDGIHTRAELEKMAMERLEKLETVIKIIKEKDIDIAWLKRHSPTLEDYNKAWCIGLKDLTQKEFDLLKEELSYE